MTPISGLLGLSARSGQITLGAEWTLREIKAGRAALVLLDAGASDGTKKKISDACAFRRVPLHMLPEGEISRACGREDRMAAAVKPGKLCKRILEMLSGPDAAGEKITQEIIETDAGVHGTNA